MLEEEIHNLVGDSGYETVVLVPLISRSEVIGLISIGDMHPGRIFDDQDINLLDQISLQVAAAIEVSRLFEQTLRRADRKRMVTEITNKIRESNDPDQIIQTAVNELREALKAQQAQIHFQPSASLDTDGQEGFDNSDGFDLPDERPRGEQ